MIFPVIMQKKRVSGMLHQLPEPPFAFNQCLLGPMAIGDVFAKHHPVIVFQNTNLKFMTFSVPSLQTDRESSWPGFAWP